MVITIPIPVIIPENLVMLKFKAIKVKAKPTSPPVIVPIILLFPILYEFSTVSFIQITAAIQA